MMFLQLKKQADEIKTNYFFPAIEKLSGNVLEIAFGKGETFSHYPNSSTVYAIEKKYSHKKINKSKQLAKCNLIIKKGTAEHLNFPSNFFDAAVVSFGLCSVNSNEKTIKEINRTLKVGGKFVLIEHVKSENKLSSIIQNILTGIQMVFGISCHLNRDPRPFLQQVKFQIINEKIFHNAFEPYLYIEAIKNGNT